MNIVYLFSSIYHNDIEKVRSILTHEPELANLIFTENKYDHTLTDQLYSLCGKDRKLGDPNHHKENALLFSAKLSRYEIAEMLVDDFNADLSSQNIYGYNALMYSLNFASDESIDFALKFAKKYPITLKHINYNKNDILGCFLKNGDYRYAGANKELSSKKTQEIIDFLLNEGFEINSEQGKNNESAFIISCLSHNWVIALYLIVMGADYSKTFKYLGKDDADMYSVLVANQFFNPKIKEELLDLMKTVITDIGSPYGEYKRPEHLYYCFLSDEVLSFDEERFGKNNK